MSEHRKKRMYERPSFLIVLSVASFLGGVLAVRAVQSAMGRSLDMTWGEWATLMIAASVGAVVGQVILKMTAGRLPNR